MDNERFQGNVIWFSPAKGFGFIKADKSDKDMFVHFQNIKMEGYKTLIQGQRVEYAIGKNDKGPQAVDVVVLEND